MNFINDLITDEDKKRFDFSVFKSAPLFMHPLSYPYLWTVDREPSVFLIKLGSGGEDDQGAQFFSLWWRNANIEMKLAFYDHMPNGITWTKAWIDIPKHLLDWQAEIYMVVKEVLTVYQTNGDYIRLIKHPLLKQPAPLTEVKFDF